VAGAGALALAVAVVLVVVGVRPAGGGPAVGETEPAAEVPFAGASEPASTVPATAYPVRLEGDLAPDLHRWLWLVKWFLAIPHFVVLVFLWAALAVLTVVAGVAILFTGRYPRAIFDLNVGVMRWTWRVTFYALALGTDRYPPFSLEPDSQYPADLAVPYPGSLSRPLVLVKWWLLALPHYLIVSIFGGGASWWMWSWAARGDERGFASFGLIGVLVAVAAVILAFTGRYPRAVFDFVMGLYRWTFRVVAYAGLMRDEYPPFRLDEGGADPGSPPASPSPEPGRSGELVSV
jgi:hypothetical protein